MLLNIISPLLFIFMQTFYTRKLYVYIHICYSFYVFMYCYYSEKYVEKQKQKNKNINKISCCILNGIIMVERKNNFISKNLSLNILLFSFLCFVYCLSCFSLIYIFFSFCFCFQLNLFLK